MPGIRCRSARQAITRDVQRGDYRVRLLRNVTESPFLVLRFYDGPDCIAQGQVVERDNLSLAATLLTALYGVQEELADAPPLRAALTIA